MSNWLLTLGRTSWRLDATDGEVAPHTATFPGNDTELLAQVEPVSSALREAGYRGEAVIVALDSAWCLAATLGVRRPRELRDRQTMLYRLEECIPWSLEDFIGDYVAAGDEVLLVAVRQAPLAEFFSQLEGRGVFLQSIVPLALLACAEHLERGLDAEVVALAHDAQVDLVYLKEGCPAAWLKIGGDVTSLKTELQQLALETGQPLRWVSCGLTNQVIGEVATSGAVTSGAEDSPTSPDVWQLGRTAADKIARGRAEPLVELRRDAFGRSRQPVALRPYRLAFHAAAVILILAWTASLAVLGLGAAREAEALQARQVDVFRKVFPNTKVPVGVLSRLESELAKLKGLQGGDEAVPNTVSATTLLHAFLAALPTDRRFIIHEIRLDEGRLSVDGEVRDHGDAEFIARRLRTKGFEIASPSTQRLDDKRVSLRVAGTRTPATQVASRKTR